MIIYAIQPTATLIKNLQGLIEFHTLHPNARLNPNDLKLIKAALALLKLDK